MANSEKVFCRKQIEAVNTTQYTCPSDASIAVITKFTVTNTSTATVNFSCNLVEGGDTVGDQNLIVDARPIAPGETWNAIPMIGQKIGRAGIISTLASAATSLTISACGYEVS